jgi:hypothetical protein
MSPLGLLELGEENGALTCLNFADERLCKDDTTPLLSEVKRQIEEYFAGNAGIRRSLFLCTGPIFKRRLGGASEIHTAKPEATAGSPE